MTITNLHLSEWWAKVFLHQLNLYRGWCLSIKTKSSNCLLTMSCLCTVIYYNDMQIKQEFIFAKLCCCITYEYFIIIVEKPYNKANYLQLIRPKVGRLLSIVGVCSQFTEKCSRYTWSIRPISIKLVHVHRSCALGEGQGHSCHSMSVSSFYETSLSKCYAT